MKPNAASSGLGGLKLEGASLVVMWVGIALFPAGVWWAQSAQAPGQDFDTSNWRIWIGFASSMLVFAIGALRRWRTRDQPLQR